MDSSPDYFSWLLKHLSLLDKGFQRDIQYYILKSIKNITTSPNSLFKIQFKSPFLPSGCLVNSIPLLLSPGECGADPKQWAASLTAVGPREGRSPCQAAPAAIAKIKDWLLFSGLHSFSYIPEVGVQGWAPLTVVSDKQNLLGLQTDSSSLR